ncbi:TPA: DUF551 domain-containing protein [Enterobacter hormaechei subsp. steigerwaltii]|nr:DUF551 domain-containing protein [Enterobacter hormaechei subsp. steigerwaltii]
MNKITNEQLDSLIKSAVNSSGPLPPDERFSQIISALRELRELRDAMLQGAEPVSNRDELPDGWVACSDRMPEQFVEVLVCTEEGSRYVAALNQSMSWDDGDFFDDIQYVTHWMPLPAAPQQEVK